MQQRSALVSIKNHWRGVFLFAIARFGEFLQLPISGLNIAYDPNSEKPLFDGFAVSTGYFLMVQINQC